MARNKKGVEVAEVLSDHCIGCQICIAECPAGAIRMSPEGTAVVDPEICIGCGKCSLVCPVGAVRFERKKRQKEAPPSGVPTKDESTPHQGVAVFIEVMDGEGAPVSWELVGKARDLSERRKARVIGLLLGHSLERVAREAISYGCDEVWAIDAPELRTYFSRTYGKALTDLSRRVKPEILLIGATHLGRDLAGIVATNLQAGLTADCTALEIDEETGVLLMTRPTFGGNILATIYCHHSRPQMSTVRPRVMRLPVKDPNRGGEIYWEPWVSPEGAIPEIVDFLKEVPEIGSPDIGRAPALVVAGKGACDPASLPLLQELAGLVGGVVACSRPVVESGLMPYARQVGQTGKTVRPRLYVACGISGAIQHLVGMQNAEYVIAINRDARAPIFAVADVGIVGDVFEIVPLLIQALREKKSAGSREGTA